VGKKARVFKPGKFQKIIIFKGKAGAYLSGDPYDAPLFGIT
jgi:hypothetical protein